LGIADSGESLPVGHALAAGVIVGGVLCLVPLALISVAGLIDSGRLMPEWAQYMGCVQIAVLGFVIVASATVACSLVPQ
jgi:hypothetical protein